VTDRRGPDLSRLSAAFGLLAMVVLGAVVLAAVLWGAARLLDAVIDSPDDEVVTVVAAGRAGADDYDLTVDVCAVDEGRAVASGRLRNTAGEQRIFLLEVVFRGPDGPIARTPVAVQVGPLDDGDEESWQAEGSPNLLPIVPGQTVECDPVQVERGEEVPPVD
jgi:hypothetical protein